MTKTNLNEVVATFIRNNAEQIIEKVILSDEVLSDEALQRVFNKIVHERKRRNIKAIQERGEPFTDSELKLFDEYTSFRINQIFSDENLERLIKEGEKEAKQF